MLLLGLILGCGSGDSVHGAGSNGAAWPVGLELDTTASKDFGEISQEMIDLGRRLFFDTRFSSDRSVSCSTCHRPELAFACDGRFSTGVGGAHGARNAPSIVNRLLGQKQFWDGRAASLEEQVVGPLFSPLEMDLDEPTLLERLSADGYPEDFHAAFGEAPSLVLFQRAIAAFERTLVSGNSPFDRYEWLGELDAIDESAKRGLLLFRGKARCTLCHTGTNFSDELFHNVGLAALEQGAAQGAENGATKRDDGRVAVTGDEDDQGAFKTPTLRNLSLTAPYMHDGRFATLEEVIEHYVRGGESGGGELVPLTLDEGEQRDLLAFLRTLDGDVVALSAEALRNKFADTP